MLYFVVSPFLGLQSKGLQKLRWFCQMCQKQCRDENGFKCHCTSESHLRQMSLFAENPHKLMDEFTSEFEEEFLELLSRRFGTRRVAANIVYNEYIADKNHLHMNSTMFETLTAFVKYLGRTGKCVIDETEKVRVCHAVAACGVFYHCVVTAPLMLLSRR